MNFIDCEKQKWHNNTKYNFMENGILLRNKSNNGINGYKTYYYSH